MDSANSYSRIYVKPNLSDLPQNITITKAIVKFNMYTTNSGQFALNECLSDWSSSLSWSTQPSFSLVNLFNLNATPSDWIEIDFTNLAQKQQISNNYGFVLKSNTSGIVNVNSMFSNKYSQTWLQPIFHYEYLHTSSKYKNKMINSLGGALV